MEHLPVTLTEFDKLILEEYCDLAEGLGEYLGSCYELVVHSFASFEFVRNKKKNRPTTLASTERIFLNQLGNPPLWVSFILHI